MDFKNIEILSYNSFFGSKLIAHFLSGCEENKIRTELIFLVLPFICKKDSREILTTVNNSSTLNSSFLNTQTGKIALAGLEKNIAFFKSLTQSSLVVAASEFEIEIRETISIINPPNYTNEKEPYIKEFFRASHYLGKILSKNEFFDTFVKLGVKDIWTVTLNK